MIGQPRDDLYLNGEFMPLASGQISVQDRGFQFADGVYEVVRFKGSRFLWLDEHLARLERGLTALAIPGVGSRDRFTRVLPELVRRSGSGEGSIYLQVTRGPAPRGFQHAHISGSHGARLCCPSDFLHVGSGAGRHHRLLNGGHTVDTL